jgi:hypothetical protein
MLIFGGCARLPDTCTTVFPRGSYCIQSTEGIEAFSALQEVEYRIKDASGRFLVRLEVDQTAFRMALLTMLGQSLGSLSYEKNSQIRIIAPGGEKYFDILMPAAYIQLALWPREKILKGLQAPSIDVRDSSGRRVLMTKTGDTIITIEYEGMVPPYDRLIMSSSEGRQVIITTLERD